ISADGIVSVGARDLETGNEHRIQVHTSSGLDSEELEALVRESQQFLIAARRSPEFDDLCSRTHKLVDGVRALLPEIDDVMHESRFGREAITKARKVIGRAEPAMVRGDTRQIEEIAAILERTLGMFQLVAQRSQVRPR
ncbi:MAG: Hsp70 family protein, partial [Nannocystaceae bacterium]